MTKKRRAAAGIVCALAALFLLSSSLYIVLEAHHDCSGEDCGICEQISSLEALLRNVPCFGILLAAAAVCPAPVRGFCETGSALCTAASPVALKVRLND